MTVSFRGQRNETWRVVLSAAGKRVWSRPLDRRSTATMERDTIYACDEAYHADDYKIGAELGWHESVEIV